MAALVALRFRWPDRPPPRRPSMLVLLPPAFAALLLLFWQSAAGASGWFEAGGEGATLAGYIAGARAALGSLDAQLAAWPALSCLVVGGAAGVLAYLLLCRFRILGFLGCVACGVVVHALIREAGPHLGFALPDGLSLLTLGVAVAACVLAVVGTRVAHGL